MVMVLMMMTMKVMMIIEHRSDCFFSFQLLGMIFACVLLRGVQKGTYA